MSFGCGWLFGVGCFLGCFVGCCGVVVVGFASFKLLTGRFDGLFGAILEFGRWWLCLRAGGM